MVKSRCHNLKLLNIFSEVYVCTICGQTKGIQSFVKCLLLIFSRSIFRDWPFLSSLYVLGIVLNMNFIRLYGLTFDCPNYHLFSRACVFSSIASTASLIFFILIYPFHATTVLKNMVNDAIPSTKIKWIKSIFQIFVFFPVKQFQVWQRMPCFITTKVSYL